MVISQVKKRDGTIVPFRVPKIAIAIEKAMVSCGIDDEELPKKIAEAAAEDVHKKFEDQFVPSVEQIQDVVEHTLMNMGHPEMAKSYILYRQKRAELRKIKENILGAVDDSNLSINGLLIAKSRYLQRDSAGNITETPKQMIYRVAKTVANAEKQYKKKEEEIRLFEEQFYDMISSLEFLPSGRIFANAGTKENMLYSSFVIPIEDSMKGIFRALYDKALVQRVGGGTGFSFSQLRPKGIRLTSTTGFASGPCAFIKLFDHASDLTVHMGNRKAANMGSLSVEHPDIVEFITMKDRREIKNFNISVEITNAFMEAVKTNSKYKLKDPSTGEVLEEIDANNIFNLIVTMAWKTGDPGILFIDKMNESNPFPSLGKIETSDPCGDQLLLPYEGGNLGAINLSQFVKYKKISWKRLEEVVKLSVRFLDNVIDISKFPMKKIEDMAYGGRRIGLGIMGFSDMLYRLGISYDSDKALETAEKIIKFISSTTYDTSVELAKEKGVFPFIDESIFKGKDKLRNSSMLAIAPTGSRSILAETSSGIEPNIALGFTRKILGSIEILQVNKVLEEVLKEHNIHTEENIKEIIKTNSLKNIQGLPDEVKKIFVTAYEITPEWHIKMQSIFQKHIDNAISKTINFHKSATIEDIKKAFLLAYDLGCRGLTVYRDGSLHDEVITFAR
jgi:ribonucleoside-diphosphate reductase alpha chain